MLNDAVGEISIAVSATSSSLVETISHLNPYTVFSFKLPDGAAIFFLSFCIVRYLWNTISFTFWLADFRTISSRHYNSNSCLIMLPWKLIRSFITKSL